MVNVDIPCMEHFLSDATKVGNFREVWPPNRDSFASSHPHPLRSSHESLSSPPSFRRLARGQPVRGGEGPVLHARADPCSEQMRGFWKQMSQLKRQRFAPPRESKSENAFPVRRSLSDFLPTTDRKALGTTRSRHQRSRSGLSVSAPSPPGDDPPSDAHLARLPAAEDGHHGGHPVEPGEWYLCDPGGREVEQ